MADQRENQPPGQLGRRIAERRGAAHQDAQLFRGGDVDGQVAHPAGEQQLQPGQLLELGSWERRPLAHGADDLEPGQTARDLVLVRQMGIEDLDRDIVRQNRPIGHAQRAALIVVDDRATLHRPILRGFAAMLAGRGDTGARKAVSSGLRRPAAPY